MRPYSPERPSLIVDRPPNKCHFGFFKLPEKLQGTPALSAAKRGCETGWKTMAKMCMLIAAAAMLMLPTFSCDAGGMDRPDPAGQLKPFLDRMADHLKSEAFQRDKKSGQYKTIGDVASEGIDFHEMSRRVLGKQWKTLTPEQQRRFIDLFSKLLRYTYIKKINEDVDKQIEIKKQRIRGQRAEVKTLVSDRNGIKPVAYRMILRQEKWMIYDIIVEGVGLVQNYGEQMRGILHDRQITGLLAMLTEKISKLEAKQESGKR
jgi:phospholipid transport system substrate-binding protein